MSDKLINFLTSSSILSNSTILLTNLEKVLFVSTEEDKKKFLGKNISNSLKNILSLYQHEDAINYLNTTMESIVTLIENDTISSYRSQIILPVVERKYATLEGLLIFFVRDRQYLQSNLNFAMTTKQFVDLFCSLK